MDEPRVESVNSSPGHTLKKPARDVIRLVEGLGIEDDAHAGRTVKHRSRVRRDASQPNLRQVHLTTPSCTTSSGSRGSK